MALCRASLSLLFVGVLLLNLMAVLQNLGGLSRFARYCVYLASLVIAFGKHRRFL